MSKFKNDIIRGYIDTMYLIYDVNAKRRSFWFER